MTTISTDSTAGTRASPFDAGFMTLASVPNTPTGGGQPVNPKPPKPFLSDQGIVIPNTLQRTTAGFEVRLDQLNESQRGHYVRLADSGLTTAQVNEIVTIILRGGVDGLTGQYSQLSADNLAGLSHLINNLDSDTKAHDVSHMLLGSRYNLSYGVTEFDENVGNALANNWLSNPRGVYEGFKVTADASGKLTVTAQPNTRQTVTDGFKLVKNNSRQLDSEFVETFKLNSKGRVEDALFSVLLAPVNGGSVDARFASFCSELKARGQLPLRGNDELNASLKTMFIKAEAALQNATTPQQRVSLIVQQSRLFTVILAAHAGTAFKSLPDDKRFRFFADQIAMVLTMNQQSPHQISIPTKETGALFSEQWNVVETTSDDPVTQRSLLAEPGFVGKYLRIRNQVRELLGVKAEKRPLSPGINQPALAPAAPGEPAKAPNSTPDHTPNNTPATPAADKKPDAPANPKLPNQGKGGWIQRPDPPQPGTINDAKPLTSPRPKPKGKDAGLLHPPSRKPEADPRSGLFTSPRPTPGKVQHTGNTKPRPKHDPNPPRFPNISDVPDDRIPTKLPTKPVPKTAATSTTTDFTWSPLRLKTTVKAATPHRPQPPKAKVTDPAMPTMAWSAQRLDRSAKVTVQTGFQNRQRQVAEPQVPLQTQIKTLRRTLDQLAAKGTPTLAQARELLNQMNTTMTAALKSAETQIKALPSQLQVVASARLGELRAAWDSWTPGALNNLQAFANGAGENLGWVLGLLAGVGSMLEPFQKLGV